MAERSSQPIIIAILANAGGVGKSTIATHLAYGLAQQHHSVTILDLDPQRSLDVFCGLDSAPYEESVVQAFAKDFKGDWHLSPVWNEFMIRIGQGHPAMSQMADDLVIRRRGEYVLRDRLAQYPIDSDVIIRLENLDLTPAEFQILSVLLDLTLNPASVKTNLVSVLALPADLKQAIREDGLKATHALALATLTGKTLLIEERLATRERINATQTVISQDLSVRQTRDLIAQIKSQFLTPQPKSEDSLPQITRSLEKLTLESLQSATTIERSQLEKLLLEKLALIRQPPSDF